MMNANDYILGGLLNYIDRSIALNESLIAARRTKTEYKVYFEALADDREDVLDDIKFIRQWLVGIIEEANHNANLS